MIKLTITLNDGTSHCFLVKRTPRHWKSWLMLQMPRGTQYFGCRCTKERV